MSIIVANKDKRLLFNNNIYCYNNLKRKISRNEAKTRKDLIDPRLKKSGWFEHDWQIDPEYKITAGRIHFDGISGKRSKKMIKE